MVTEQGRWSTRIELGERSYPIHVAQGLLGETGILIRETLPGVTKSVIVTSPIINDLYGKELKESIGGVELDPGVSLVPDGEEAKSWDHASGLIGEFLDHELDRKSVVVALGGGAVGDLAGFTASIYMRGVRVVQVPTTLLAQVDSSIGGKTAVNHPKGKNLIGAFHQPALVAADPALLGSLPPREIRSGLGEIVKLGVISDHELFRQVEDRGDALLRADPGEMTEAIRRCVSIKARYVELDERDSKGVRAALNYGHTLGHALEALTSHGLRHGEAIVIGMVAASHIAEEMGLIGEPEVQRQVRLFEELGLETRIPELEASTLVEVMHRDKKAEGGSIRFVLPTGIGREPVLRPVPDERVTRVLEEMMDG
jgi:3-dehydroquinate synthase